MPTGLMCPPDAPIVAHFDALQDTPGLRQCIGWGPRMLTPQEAETFRFLQVVDAGSGTSSRVAQGMLSYARRLGENGPAAASNRTGLLVQAAQGN